MSDRKGKEGGDKKGKTTDDNIISDRSPVGTSRSYTAGDEKSWENPSTKTFDWNHLVDELTTDPASLTVDQLPELLDECERIEDLIKGIRERAKQLILSGETVTGWRVSEVRRQEIIDQEAAFARIWTDYGKEVAVRCIKLSLPMAAAAVAGSAEISRRKAQERLSRTLSALIVEAVSTRLWRERE
jgi:hypothetical protein